MGREGAVSPAVTALPGLQGFAVNPSSTPGWRLALSHSRFTLTI